MPWCFCAFLPKQGFLALQVPAAPMSWNLSIDDGTRTHQLSLGQAMKQGYNFLVDGHNLIFQVAFAATGVVSYKVCERRISKEEPPSPCLASTVSLLIWGVRFQARARADALLGCAGVCKAVWLCRAVTELPGTRIWGRHRVWKPPETKFWPVSPGNI